MTFDPIIVSYAEKLTGPGEAFSVTGTVDVDAYEVGGQRYTLDNGFSYDIVLTHTGDGVLASGMVRAHARGVCDRCLDPAEFDVAGAVEEYYLFEEPETDEEREEGFALVGPEETVDLSDALADAVVMDTPFVLLCRPDCKGLCPVCGCNLNHEQCDCADKAEEERVMSDENPFAALKNLKLDE